jgi:hypothetical protein
MEAANDDCRIKEILGFRHFALDRFSDRHHGGDLRPCSADALDGFGGDGRERLAGHESDAASGRADDPLL